MGRAPYTPSLILTSPCLREDLLICSYWLHLSHWVTCELFVCSMTTQAGTRHGKKKNLSSLNKNPSCTICMFYTLTCLTKRFVSKVIVQDLQSRHVWHFFCNCWLSADQGDGITKKTFNAAKRNEIASFRSEFFTPEK